MQPTTDSGSGTEEGRQFSQNSTWLFRLHVWASSSAVVRRREEPGGQVDSFKSKTSASCSLEGIVHGWV